MSCTHLKSISDQSLSLLNPGSNKNTKLQPPKNSKNNEKLNYEKDSTLGEVFTIIIVTKIF